MEPDKKKIIIIGGGAAAILGGLLVASLVFLKPKQPEPILPALPTRGEPTEVLAPLVTWEDPAGFSFDYPGNLDTNSHEEDKENYVHLELMDSEHAGGIIIWMKDTNYEKIEDWVRKETEAVNEQIFALTLGGHQAKKVVSADGRIVTAALDEEVIVLVELVPGPGYSSYSWQPIYDQIIASFKFIPLAVKETAPPVSAGGTSEIWEEEEVVE